MDDNYRIVLLDDGETFSASGYLCEVTEEAMEEILDGRKVRDMLGEGVTIVEWINNPPGDVNV